ncbi:HepT-like ribonuclease domain-containing protein [Rhizobium sp. S152]|uniref:HepT-like ribonuclease domain-containing protein n=1 Tax=Rhizobium sp. S152 TaxID=3055038 RepID=UPI0030149EA7
MAREIRHLLDDIHAAINGIENAATGKLLHDYQTDWLLRHALQRAVEIISEASRALPDEIKDLRPEIPWPQVRAIGNVLRHEYHGLSDHILWGVIIDEIPRL